MAVRGHMRGQKGYLRSEDGNASIEMVFILPLFLAFFTLIGDVAMLFYHQAKITSLIQTANREYAVGQLASAAATEEYIVAQLEPLTENAEATTQTVAEFITTTVSVPARDLIAVGLLAPLLNFNLVVRAEQVNEQ